MLHINNSSYQGYFITMTKIPRTLHIYDISYQGYFISMTKLPRTLHINNNSYQRHLIPRALHINNKSYQEHFISTTSHTKYQGHFISTTTHTKDTSCKRQLIPRTLHNGAGMTLTSLLLIWPVTGCLPLFSAWLDRTAAMSL